MTSDLDIANHAHTLLIILSLHFSLRPPLPSPVNTQPPPAYIKECKVIANYSQSHRGTHRSHVRRVFTNFKLPHCELVTLGLFDHLHLKLPVDTCSIHSIGPVFVTDFLQGNVIISCTRDSAKAQNISISQVTRCDCTCLPFSHL